ncbi:hypothetical protein H632_c2605p1 [Helicosporidium sp. ATCC 50920]|nr:hypothetical protein H632_c2605p1 [Helicosporidium sp. ATCC 50920]|eukprot:KDD73038.1 hypothetical protein H632_c2605p1 [Helicosporidium sp. ATCC 50920]
MQGANRACPASSGRFLTLPPPPHPVGVVLASAAGFALYRWKMRDQMHSEIRAIMRDYMPLGEEAAPGKAPRRAGRNGFAAPLGDEEDLELRGGTELSAGTGRAPL